MCKISINESTNALGFMNIILLLSNNWPASATRGLFQGDENNNTNTTITCGNHNTLKNHIYFF
jgi:hypothetical protein